MELGILRPLYLISGNGAHGKSRLFECFSVCIAETANTHVGFMFKNAPSEEWLLGKVLY
jgi:hypothetical protein